MIVRKIQCLPYKSIDSIFFNTGKCTILQIVFDGNLQSSSLYKYLPIAHFICMGFDVCMYTEIYTYAYIYEYMFICQIFAVFYVMPCNAMITRAQSTMTVFF